MLPELLAEVGEAFEPDGIGNLADRALFLPQQPRPVLHPHLLDELRRGCPHLLLEPAVEGRPAHRHRACQLVDAEVGVGQALLNGGPNLSDEGRLVLGGSGYDQLAQRRLPALIAPRRRLAWFLAVRTLSLRRRRPGRPRSGA